MDSPLASCQSPVDNAINGPSRAAMSKHPYTAGHQQASGHSPPRRGQGFLGATATLAAIGAILLYYTNALASQCRADLKPRTGPGACSGLPDAAYHLQGLVTAGVIACVAVFAITFIWSLLWA
jgi:hypothetical protein